MAYRKLMLMLIISFVIMYAVMFMNVARAEHIYLSVNRLYMALLMVTPMAVMMLMMMSKMYPDKKKNTLIIAGSLGLFVITIFLLRNQVFIGEQQYMKAMIPHHSSAILTSKKADITDPEVKKLADEIIRTQEEEITIMKNEIKRLKENR